MTILTFRGGQRSEFSASAIWPATIVPNGFIGYGLIGNVTDILASHSMPQVRPDAAGRYFRVVCVQAWARFRTEGFRP